MSVTVMKRAAVAVAAALAVSALAAGALADGFSRVRTYTPGQFADVAESAWYAPYVRDAYELGLMDGTGEGTFSPSGAFTVGQALTVAGKLHSAYNGGDGTVPGDTGDPERDALCYCVENGIAPGGEIEDLGRAATRAEMDKLISAAMPDRETGAINAVEELPDVNEGTEGREAILRLYEAGILTGRDEFGSFAPDSTVERREAAAILARCADPAKRVKLELAPVSLMYAPELSPEQEELLKGAYRALADSDIDALEELAASDVIPELYREVLGPYNERRADFIAGDDYSSPLLHGGETYRVDFDGERVGLGLEAPEDGMVMEARVTVDPGDDDVRTLSFTASGGGYERVVFVTRVMESSGLHMMTSYYKDDGLPAGKLGGEAQVMLSRNSTWTGAGFDVSQVMYFGKMEWVGLTRVLTDGRATFSCELAGGESFGGYALVRDGWTYYKTDTLLVTARREDGAELTTHTVWLRCGERCWASFAAPAPAPEGFTNGLWYRQFPFVVYIQGPTWDYGPDLRYEISLE